MSATGPLPDPTGALVPGAVLLGRYRLVAPIGEGLGGETWRAQPVDGGPPVAIKVVRGGHGDQPRADLLREASFLRELQHPHVVVYGGVIDLPGTDTTFLVTSLAEDGSLEDYVTLVGPRSPPQAAGLLLQLVDGLEAVHAGGVLHRDLKPQNVLVRNVSGGAPHLLLADFGIARRTIGNSASLTRPMGSLGYGAPEIWTDGVVTHAADIYGLGAIAWYLLTARHPVPKAGSTLADPAQLDAAVGPHPPAPVSALVGLIHETMRLDAATRPSLQQVRVRLNRIVDGPGPPATTLELPPPVYVSRPRAPASGPTLVWDEPAPRRSRWPVVAAVVGAVALVWILGAAALMGFAAWVGKDALDAAEVETPVAPAPVAAAPVEPVAAPPVPTDPPPVAPVPSPRPHVAEEPLPIPPPVVAEPVVASAEPTVAPEPLVVSDRSEPGGRVGTLRVGLEVPSGLPADATLHVTGPDGTTKEVTNTQLLLREGRAGIYTIEVRVPTRLLGRARLVVPAGDAVRVACAVPGGDFGAMACAVR
jgi:serine/threonine protein kinase